ncbi:MAG TPA: NAD(P)/FAD-dependent oxidoreductase [Thermodesulfovibrionales bacterium]|nr:NAD(P)/FAD-dependent oxidoreductase [Thermodesulfovibrionales bacterium]
MKRDIVIIGAGAAGLMCAVSAGRRKRNIVILEHAGSIGKKILVSGGGHCNFTNVRVDHEHYFSRNPHFCKSALARFTPFHFIEMLRRYGIAFYEREEGRLFCKGSSRAITDMLRMQCNEAGVEILLNCCVEKVVRDRGFIVLTSQGKFRSESLVIATGGLSYPRLGATDIGYRIASEFGLEVVPTRPALVPLIFSPMDLAFFRELSGISVDVSVRSGETSFRGNVLFTHRGLSGPAVLQVSSLWDKGNPINLDLFPKKDIFALLKEKRDSKMELQTFLSLHLPRRLARKWCQLYVPSRPLCQFNDSEIRDTAYRLHNWEITPQGTEGFGKAEVTLGGIETGELSSKTMEAKRLPGLYFAGEVIDVTGQLGGYNLHWAWASGHAAGQHA